MSTPGSARARQPKKESYHHGDLRRALMNATLELVQENGPQAFTLRAAARAAGVTPGAAYHHFESKDALIGAVAEEGFEILRSELETAAKAPAATPRDRSRNVGIAYVLFAIKHPTRFRVMLGFGAQDLRQGKIATPAIAIYQLVRQTLLEGLKTNPTDKVSDAEVLGWWSVVHGLAFLAIDGHLGKKVGASPDRAREVVREVIAALEERRER